MSKFLSDLLGGLFDRLLSRAWKAISNWFKIKQEEKKIDEKVDKELKSVQAARDAVKAVMAEIAQIEQTGAEPSELLKQRLKDAQSELRKANRHLVNDFMD